MSYCDKAVPLVSMSLELTFERTVEVYGSLDKISPSVL